MASADHQDDREQRQCGWLLGPAQVRTPDGWVGVGAPKLRVLLAMLAGVLADGEEAVAGVDNALSAAKGAG